MAPCLPSGCVELPTRHAMELGVGGSPNDMSSPLHASVAGGPCKLFVGGISAQTTTEALRDHFSKYGRLIDAVVMSKNGRPRGFGFVTYDMPGPAFMALGEPQWLDGRLVDVKRAVPGERAQERTANKIFVGGLPQDVSTEDLKAYFSTYGSVADAVVMVDRRTNRSRGFGFVRFGNGAQGSAAAEAVLMDFNSHRLSGKWVEVKRATPAAVLQALAPCDGGVDGILGNPATLAVMEQSMGFCLMDMTGSDACMGPCSPSSPMATVATLATPARSHARGRRGRRRKQRSGTASEFALAGTGDGFSDAEDGADDRSPCSVVLPSSGSGSPLNTAYGTPPPPPPGLSCPAGGAVAFVPTGTAAAAAASAAATAAWGSPQRNEGCSLKPLLPLTVEPMNCGLSVTSTAYSTPGGRCDASSPLSCGRGSADENGSPDASENDPSRANFAVSRFPPGLCAGADASPMKVACRDDRFGPMSGYQEWLDVCTREDFLSLEAMAALPLAR